MESQENPCWQYLELNQKAYPVLEVAIVGPSQRRPGTTRLVIPVDTGYDGFILLSEEEFQSLGFNLAELPRKYWPEAETVTGEVFKLRRASSIVQITEVEKTLEGHVETFQGNKENLLGLEFIQDLNLLLQGPKKQTCLF